MAANYLTPRTLATSVIGLIALGILLFVPAGTLAYWQGWLFIDLLVMLENTFSASTVRVEQGQTVISTGPYAIARHPMYAGVVVMVVGVPLALDSWLGLLVLVLTIPVLVLRILDEEKLLKDELRGYREYAQHVRYR